MKEHLRFDMLQSGSMTLPLDINLQNLLIIGGIRVDAPAAIRNANFSENVIISNSSSSAANAVVQAGGAVRINATQDLTNGVVREGITLGSGASRVGVTALSGRAAPTVVLLNAQLPPNPLNNKSIHFHYTASSLPTGQNGLFRLSSQAINPTSTGDTPSPSWTLGTAAVSLQERDREVTPAPARLTALGNDRPTDWFNLPTGGDGAPEFGFGHAGIRI